MHYGSGPSAQHELLSSREMPRDTYQGVPPVGVFELGNIVYGSVDEHMREHRSCET